MDIYELMEKGGALMIPILLASVIAAMAFFERTWSLQRRSVVPGGFIRALRNLIGRRDLDTAETLCAENGSSFAHVVQAALRHRGGGRALMKEAMEEAGQLETVRLGRFVGITGTVATISPLLGLLGTVTGMIKVFKDVAELSDPQINVLARGIWEALLTTGAGLTVAIPSFLGYRYLLSRVDLLATEMEEQALEMLDAITAERTLAPNEPVRPVRAGTIERDDDGGARDDDGERS